MQAVTARGSDGHVTSGSQIQRDQPAHLRAPSCDVCSDALSLPNLQNCQGKC